MADIYEIDKLREELKTLSSVMKVISILRERSLEISDLKEKAKDAIGVTAPSREIPNALETDYFIKGEDDNPKIISVNTEAIKRVIEGVLYVAGMSVKDLLDDQEISEPQPTPEEAKEGNIISMWQELKRMLFEAPAKGAEELVVEDEDGKEIVREQITVYPYMPCRNPQGRALRKPLFAPYELMTEKALEKNDIKAGAGIFKRIVDLRKSIAKDQSKDTPEKKDEAYDKAREEEIRKLMTSRDFPDDTKIAMYSILTELDDPSYFLLRLAVENGIPAESMIGYLEAPTDAFNIEGIRMYVSAAGNTESKSRRLKLARDLVDGRWKIMDRSGIKYKVYSETFIERLKDIIIAAADGQDVAGYISDRMENTGFPAIYRSSEMPEDE